jgi:hypothetical protein
MPTRYFLGLALASALALLVGYDYGTPFGLAIGMPALLATAGLYFWFSRTGSDAAWVYRIDDGRGTTTFLSRFRRSV